MTEYEQLMRLLTQVERRVLDLDKRVIELTKHITHIALVVDVAYDVAADTVITEVNGSVHIPGVGTLGGSHGRGGLSAEAEASLALLEDEW